MGHLQLVQTLRQHVQRPVQVRRPRLVGGGGQRPPQVLEGLLCNAHVESSETLGCSGLAGPEAARTGRAQDLTCSHAQSLHGACVLVDRHDPELAAVCVAGHARHARPRFSARRCCTANTMSRLHLIT